MSSVTINNSASQPVDWLLRVGDGENLKRSSNFKIWGIDSNTSNNKHFLKNVKLGDRLWFVKSKSHGKILAVATYRYNIGRNDTSFTNEELGWEGSGTDWTANVEVHYSDLHDLNVYDLLTHIKSPLTIRKYDCEKCKVNLPMEFTYIVRYCKVVSVL
jgi:hypothetical protein